MHCGTSRSSSNYWPNTVRRLSAAVVALTLANSVALAEWQVTSSATESAGAIEHRHLEMANSVSGEPATLDLALFSAKGAKLRLIDNANGSDSLREAMAREKCLAGVNGGYFDTSFKPLGLRVIDGEVTSSLIHARLLTGVLGTSARGVEIMRLSEFSHSRHFQMAVEGGPFLVDAGARVRNLNDTRSARRTFAAMMRGEKAALGVSSELTLAQLAEALTNRSLANDFKISRAVNLDGGSSSAFWFRRNDRSIFSISEEKSVRDFVGVVAR
jgi:uncharacterized protein YigE (DUF2233 family)